MSALASGDFWAFVGVVAGIYTIFALGLQLAVRLHRAPQLRPGRVHGDRRVHDGDPRREGRRGARGSRRRSRSASPALAGLLLGLPSLRLRADYFAIVTIAFSEIVRYVATNEDRLTGGSQGTIALGRVGEAAQYNGAVGALPGPGRGRGCTRLEGRRDARDRLGRRLVLLVARLAGRPHALGAGAARDPRGRGRRRLARQERRSPTSSRRSRSAPRSAASPGVFYAWQFSFFSPDDFQPLLTFFAWMIVILGGSARVWAVPVGALVFGFLFAGTRFLDFAPLSLPRLGRARLPAADRDRARDLIVLIVLPPAGAPRAGARRWCSSERAARGARGDARFGGVRAVDGASLDVEPGSITGADRAERRRQVDALQLHLRLPAAGAGRVAARRQADRPPPAAPDRAGRARPHVPDAAGADADDRARERHARRAAPSGRAARRLRDRRARPRASGRLQARAARAARAGAPRRARGALAGTLSGGQRKLLDLVRALMAEPRLLLLDEPMAGVSPTLRGELLEHILELRERDGITLLIVEHDLDFVMRACDRVIVMNEGRVIARGHARRGAPRRAGGRRLSRARTARAMSAPRGRRARGGLRATCSSCTASRSRVGARRDRRRDRAERRRQVDAAEGDLRARARVTRRHRALRRRAT